MIKDPLVFLEHILDSMNLIQGYLDGIDEETFHRSVGIQDQVVRRIEIIGEATKNLSDDIRGKYPDVPWKRMAGMRDVMIHQYFGIDFNVVWKTATQFIPPVKKQIEAILQKENNV